MRGRLALLAALAVLPGCGADDETASGPQGPLAADAIGPVRVGMTPAEVERLFGRPDRKRSVNLGLGPPPEVDWIWARGGTRTRLRFDTRSDELAGYCTDDPRLATSDGVRPRGETLGMLRRRYGDRLDRTPTGPEGPVPANYTIPRNRSGLTFAVGRNSEVASICGGLPRPAGE